MRVTCRSTWILMLAVCGTGCIGDKGTLTPEVSASTLIGGLTASPPNAILAVGGTQQVSLSAVSLTGTPITTFDSVLYVLNAPADTLRVKVGAQGLITGVAPSTVPVLVNVFAFQGGGVKGDQVVLQVTPSSVAGATLSIQPSDSAKWSQGLVRTITPVIQNPTTGARVLNPALKYTVKLADLTRVRVYVPTLLIPGPGTAMTVQAPPSPVANTNQILPLAGEGAAWVYAAVNAYGTPLQDSIQYTFSYPYAQQILIRAQNLAITAQLGVNQTYTLAPGATVTFQNSAGSSVPGLTLTFTFDTPAAATAATPPSTNGGATGNITTLIGGQSSLRRFLTPGTYHWTTVAAGGVAPYTGQTVAGVLVIK